MLLVYTANFLLIIAFFEIKSPHSVPKKAHIATNGFGQLFHFVS